MCAGIHIHTCLCTWRVEVNIRTSDVVFYGLPPNFFTAEFITKPAACYFWVDLLASGLWHLSVSTPLPPTLEIQTQAAVPSFYMDVQDPNSDLHANTVGTLPADPCH